MFCVQIANPADVIVTTDHNDGIYRIGERVEWSISCTDVDQPSSRSSYTIQAGGKTVIASRELTFIGSTAKVSVLLNQPGTLLMHAKIGDTIEVISGAAVSWQEIKPALNEPGDFDEYWQNQLANLASVPMDPILEQLESGDDSVYLWKISLGNIHGTRVYGYIARPSTEGSCPVMLQMQYSGVYPLKREWVIEPAKQGWMAMNIMAHDLPADRDKAFYDEMAAGPLKNYFHMGRNDRDSSYFLRMYVACYRAVDYLATRSDWNGKTLIVQGGSQGGMQAIVAAALHPAVTTVCAKNPAGCDHAGPLLGRNGGWPQWLGDAQGADRDARLVASGYYDLIHFARRVRCPALVATGLIDSVCPSAGVFAMFNQLGGRKRIVIVPQAGHIGPHPAYNAVAESLWQAAKSQQPLPIP